MQSQTFQGLEFHLQLGFKDKQILSKLIKENGGTISFSPNRKTTHIVVSNDEFERRRKESEERRGSGVSAPIVVTSAFLHDSIQIGKVAEISLETPSSKAESVTSGTKTQREDPPSSTSSKKQKKEITFQHQGKWRTARVFISSTFRDMHGERDVLTRQVFPELQERCNKLRVHVTPVDLRWGVTEEQTGQALELCLVEVDQCRPFFIGLLGERYGWVPNSYSVPDEARFDWVNRFPSGKSITHLEMYYGHLQNPKNSRACFYFRDPSFIEEVPYELWKTFKSEDDAAEENLKKLKQEIINTCPRVYQHYPCKWGGVVEGKPSTSGLDFFAERVLEDLWTQLLEEFPPSMELPNELTISRSYHEHFVENHSMGFVGREALLNQLTSLARASMTESSGPIVIVGEPGGGKTSLVATFVRNFLKAESSNATILYHFVGAAPGSTSLRRTLGRLCSELVAAYNLEDEIPEEFSELQALFLSLLQKLPSTRPLVLVIDALNQLDDVDNPFNLGWLPDSPFPSGLCIVVSTLAGKYLTSLQRRKISEVRVGPLSSVDRKEIVRKVLWEYRKKLDERAGGQMDQLLLKKESEKPLYLIVACEELRVFGVYEQLSERIKSLPETVPQLFGQVLARLETDHGSEFVQNALSFLVSSRGGLQESEMLGLLGGWAEYGKHEVLPHSIWAKLYRSLHIFLRPPGENGEGVLDFFHRQLAKAIQTRYFSGTQGQQYQLKIHQKLANFFLKKADPEGHFNFTSNAPRAISELPYHLLKGKMFEKLEEVLTSLSFIEAKASIGMAFDLLSDLNEAEEACGESRKKILETHKFVRARAHLISRNPELTFSLAINMPDSSLTATSAQSRWNNKLETRPHVRWTNKRQTEDPCLMTLTGHTHPIRACAFNPNPSAKQIVSASDDDTLKVWNSQTGAEIFTLKGHKESVVGCAFSPKGDLIVSSSYDKTLKVWSCDTGVELLTLTGHRSAVNDCCFSNDGAYIASASSDKTVILWSAKTGQEIRRFNGHTGTVNCCSFSPDDQYIITGSMDKTARIWNVESGDEEHQLKGHFHQINDAIFSSDGSLIVTTSDDKHIKIWTFSGQFIRNLSGHKDGVTSCCFSCDGKLLITGSHDNMIKFWNQQGEEIGSLSGHTGSVLGISLSPDDSRLISSSFDRVVKVWDLKAGFSSQMEHEGRILDLDCTADGEIAVTASRDKTLKVWDAFKGKLFITLKGHVSNVFGCSISSDKKWIASASRDNTVRLWDCKTGMEVRTLTAHKASVNDCCFSPHCDRLISVSDDKLIKMWDVETGTEVATLYGHRAPVTCCAYSPDGNRLVTGSADTTLKIWDTRTRAKLGTILAHKKRVTSCDFSKDGLRVISGAEDNLMKEFNAQNAKLIATFSKHKATVTDCRYSRNGAYIFSGSTDGSVIVWDAQTKKDLCSFACLSRVTSVCPSGEDHSFCVGDGSGGFFLLEAIGLEKRNKKKAEESHRWDL